MSQEVEERKRYIPYENGPTSHRVLHLRGVGCLCKGQCILCHKYSAQKWAPDPVSAQPISASWVHICLDHLLSTELPGGCLSCSTELPGGGGWGGEWGWVGGGGRASPQLYRRARGMSLLF